MTDPPWRVRITGGGDRISRIYRVDTDSKSASSLRTLPQSVEFSVQCNLNTQVKIELALE